jgi:Putative beta barrel porin-7 (BBP7)
MPAEWANEAKRLMHAFVHGDFAMTNRILVALGLTLLVAHSSFAQDPAEDAAPAPKTVTVDAAPWSEPMISAAPEEPSSPGQQFWATAGGLAGWIQRASLPPLVTTSLPGTSQANAGVLGLNTTNVLVQGPAAQGTRSGFTLGAGYWLDCDHTLAVDVGFRMLSSESTIYSLSSNNDPILARPFFNATTNAQDAQLVAFPGTSISSATGNLTVQANSGSFYDAHLDLTGNVCPDICGCRLDAILGYRFYRYDESLRISQSMTPTGPTGTTGFPAGTKINSADDFNAENYFNGVDFGLKGHWCWSDLSLDLLAKAAVGNVHRMVDINGFQEVEVPGAKTVVNSGGLLALSSNIGRHPSEDWTIMPEFGGTLSWQVTCNIKLYAGYSILWLDEIARAATQVDLNVNPTLLPPQTAPSGPNVPAFDIVRSQLWIQTATIGVEFSF